MIRYVAIYENVMHCEHLPFLKKLLSFLTCFATFFIYRSMLVNVCSVLPQFEM